jgi:hypothetical protein
VIFYHARIVLEELSGCGWDKKIIKMFEKD